MACPPRVATPPLTARPLMSVDGVAISTGPGPGPIPPMSAMVTAAGPHTGMRAPSAGRIRGSFRASRPQASPAPKPAPCEMTIVGRRFPPTWNRATLSGGQVNRVAGINASIGLLVLTRAGELATGSACGCDLVPRFTGLRGAHSRLGTHLGLTQCAKGPTSWALQFFSWRQI